MVQAYAERGSEMGLVNSNAFDTYDDADSLARVQHQSANVPAFQPEFDEEMVRPRHDIARRTVPQAAPQSKKSAVVKPKRSYGSAIRIAIFAITAVGLVGMYLVREERVAAATTEINKLRREIESLDLTYESRRTQFECSTNLEVIRRVASENLNMGDWNEDQVSEIDYHNQAAMSIDYKAVCDKLLIEQTQGNNVLDAVEGQAVTSENESDALFDSGETDLYSDTSDGSEPEGMNGTEEGAVPDFSDDASFSSPEEDSSLNTDIDSLIPEENAEGGLSFGE